MQHFAKASPGASALIVAAQPLLQQMTDCHCSSVVLTLIHKQPVRKLATSMQKLGMPDKEEGYGLAAHRREVAIAALMTVPSRPGVWTDLVIAGPVDSFETGIKSILAPDCRLVQRDLCVATSTV